MERGRWKLNGNLAVVSALVITALALVGCPGTQTDPRLTDSEAPTIQITSHENGDAYTAITRIEGTITDADGSGGTGQVVSASYSVNTDFRSGEIAPDSTGAFVAEFSDDGIEGLMKVEITAVDWNDNSSTVAINLYPPRLMTYFGFLKSKNPQLEDDLEGLIGDNTILVALPGPTDVSSLVASFEYEGEYVTFGGEIEYPGQLAHDFTDPQEYVVVANDNSESVYTVTVSALPFPPENLSLTSATPTQVIIGWDHSGSNEDGFTVERKAGSGEYEVIATLPENTTTYLDTGFSGAAVYTYLVTSFNEFGSSPGDPLAVDMTPAAPTGLSLTSISDGEIVLGWTDNTTLETGYLVERAAGAGPFADLETMGTNSETYTDTTFSGATTYTYRVTAFNAHASSDPDSLVVDVTPAEPSGLSASVFNASTIDLAWTDNSTNESGFSIERKIAPEVTFNEITTVSASTTTYRDLSASPGDLHTYRVIAYNADAASDPSNEVTVDAVGYLEVSKLLAGDGAADDRFGDALSVSGDYAAVGSRYDDSPTDSGSVYIFKRNAGSGEWEAVDHITASDGEAEDNFGHAVSMDGDYLAIGSIGDDDNDVNAGAVYLFERLSGDTWTEVDKVVASGGSPYEYDYFGRSVSLSGTTLVAGAEWDDDRGDSAGAAYVFERNGGTGEWDFVTKLTASDGLPYDYFGVDVAVSGDIIVVGAEGLDDMGSLKGGAYIFAYNAGVWEETDKIFPADMTGISGFGERLELDGDYAVIGGYQGAFVFKRDFGADTFSETQELLPDDATPGWFGSDVSIHGSTTVVAAKNDGLDGPGFCGSVYVYERTGETWAQTAKIVASDRGYQDYFGTAVDVDGIHVMAGSPADDDNGSQSGSAYLFRYVE